MQKQDDEKQVNEFKPVSHEIYLEGGHKYKFEFYLYHTVHMQYTADGVVEAKILWSSKDIETEIIPSRYFFQDLIYMEPKIISYDDEIIELVIMKENQDAFRNNVEYKMQDIPEQFLGLTMIRKPLMHDPIVTFEMSSWSVVYVAVEWPSETFPDEHYEMLIDTEFEDTGEVMTLLHIPKDNPIINPNMLHKEAPQKMADESIRMKILQKKFIPGQINVSTQRKDKEEHYMKTIFFYSQDGKPKQQKSCGGQEINVSSPLSEAFFECSISGKKRSIGYGCEQAFSTKMVDQPDSIWATEHAGLGSWIKLELKKDYLINRFQYRNREDKQNRNARIEISFGKNTDFKQEFSLSNTNHIQNFILKQPVQTSEITISITEIYTNGENGGSINIFGYPCMMQYPQIDVVEEYRNKNATWSLGCEDSFENNKDLSSIPWKYGDKVRLLCQQNCLQHQAKVFGDDIYSVHSSICRSAIHSCKLSSHEIGLVFAEIVKSPRQFYSKQKNQIQSHSSKGFDDFAIVFEKVWEYALQIAKIGQEVDMYCDDSNWKPGVLTSIDYLADKVIQVSVQIENTDESYIQFWPSMRIAYCGEMIKNRNCKPESRDPGGDNDSIIRINFGLEEIHGYWKDNGTEFGYKNGTMQYGWSRDNQERLRSTKPIVNPLNDNLILFNPDSKSKYCDSSNHTLRIDCQYVHWKIAVIPGFYDVEILIGDSENAARYDLQVNNIKMETRWLKQNVFHKLRKERIQDINGFIVVNSECPEDQDCRLSWSRISTVTIKKSTQYYAESNAISTANRNTRRFGCGYAFERGKCFGGDVENCIYQEHDSEGASECYGDFKLVKVAHQYKCAEQQGLLKCIRKYFPDKTTCQIYCPAPCDHQARCLAKDFFGDDDDSN